MLLFKLSLLFGVKYLNLLNFFPCVEARVRFGDFSSDFDEVSGELNRKFFDEFWVCCSEVIGFANIFFDVVEFLMAVFVVADELVVTIANNARWFTALIAIVRVVPIENAFRKFSSEGGDKRDAVDMVSRELFESSKFEERGEEVSTGRKLARN